MANMKGGFAGEQMNQRKGKQQKKQDGKDLQNQFHPMQQQYPMQMQYPMQQFQP